jgi:hypothetical protein
MELHPVYWKLSCNLGPLFGVHAGKTLARTGWDGRTDGLPRRHVRESCGQANRQALWRSRGGGVTLNRLLAHSPIWPCKISAQCRRLRVPQRSQRITLTRDQVTSVHGRGSCGCRVRRLRCMASWRGLSQAIWDNAIFNLKQRILRPCSSDL